MTLVDLVASDADIRITKDGSTDELALGPGVVSVEYDLTIDGASTVTVTVADQARALYSSGLLDADKDAKLDADVILSLGNDSYTLGGLQKSGDQFQLIFEDSIVAKLRRARGALKPRDGEGHVKFAKRLALAVGAEFVTPTGTPTLPPPASKSKAKAKTAQKKSDTRREPGIADGASLKVKGAAASGEQKRNMNTVLAICAREGAGPKATLACVAACIVESTFRNLTYGDRDSVGILQLRVGLHGAANARSIDKSVTLFLNRGFTGRGGAKAIAKGNPGMTPGQVAQAVQGSAFPTAYDQYMSEARAIVAAGGGITGSTEVGVSDASTSSTGGRSPVQRGTPENPRESSWEALQRIAGERGYRCFVLRNVVYYAREQDLIRSRPRMTVSEDTPGVDWIDGNWIPNARVNTATITGRAGLWDAPPGSSVVIEDTGPLSGRWLVSSFQRSRYSVDATIELRRGTELLKPQPITKAEATTKIPAGGKFPNISFGTGGTSTTGSAGSPGGGIKLGSAYSGTQSIFDQFVHPFMRKQGLRAGDQKRQTKNTASGGVSDHWIGNKRAYATDYPTFNGAGPATALAKAMGQSGWRPGGYGKFPINVDGRRFIVQILWASDSDHIDHIHVGITAA